MKAYGSKVIVGVPNYGGWITDNQAPLCKCCNGRYAKVTSKGKAKYLKSQKKRARRNGKCEIKYYLKEQECCENLTEFVML